MSLREMLQPKVVELGSVRIGTLGEERSTRSGTGTWRPPVKLDHFIITTNARDKSGQLIQDNELMERLAQEWGDQRDGKLRAIPITLLSDRIEDSLRSAYVHYRGKTCLARSDGVTLWKYADFKTGQMLPEPEEREWDENFLELKHNGAPVFKKHTVMDFVIRSSQARWGGVYRFRTTSRISGDQLYGSLLHLQRLTNGVMTGMPLMLVVRPMQVAPEGKPTTVHVVHVELHGADLEQLQMRALEVAKFQKTHLLEMRSLRSDVLKLTSDPGVNEDEYTMADVQQEFHPDELETGVSTDGDSTDLDVDISTSLNLGGDEPATDAAEPSGVATTEKVNQPAAAPEKPATEKPVADKKPAAKSAAPKAKPAAKTERDVEVELGTQYRSLSRRVELCGTKEQADQLREEIVESHGYEGLTDAGKDQLLAALDGNE